MLPFYLFRHFAQLKSIIWIQLERFCFSHSEPSLLSAVCFLYNKHLLYRCDSSFDTAIGFFSLCKHSKQNIEPNQSEAQQIGTISSNDLPKFVLFTIFVMRIEILS